MERRRAETRGEIISAAWELARETGLVPLSVRRLAQRVGMRAPSLYSYFASKDAIYDAMFAEGQIQLARTIDAYRQPSRAGLRAATHAFFDFCVSDPVRYQLMFQRTIPGFEPTPESYALAIDNLERIRAQLVSAGITSSQHHDLWTAIVTGLVAQQMSNEPEGRRWRDLVDEAVDVFSDHTGLVDEPESTSDNKEPT